QEIIKLLPGVPVEEVDDYRKIRIAGDTINSVYEESKEYLVLARKNGEMVKEFRCMSGLVGKTEYFIVHGNNCFIDCKYCFLQNYFEHAVPTLFVNHEEILDSIRNFILTSKEGKPVFHAGELCDSFLYDNLTRFSTKLVNLFSEFPDSTLELRTKTVTIDNLLTTPAQKNVIVSWTFSPQNIIDVYERNAPSLNDRIYAAQKVQKAGYNVGICFDPIIYSEGWQGGYKSMINTLFDKLDVSKIAYISLGGFRYLTALAGVVRERGIGNNLIAEEFVPCVDGKYRYFRPIRVEIYKEIVNIIRVRSRQTGIYLCMETPEIWDDVSAETDLTCTN
ncbi:MAG: spore photoproduct lyase family protein, partial [Candidatus Anammoxibacter sp.]